MLFQLSDDPGEANNLLEREPARAERMQAELLALIQSLEREREAVRVQELDPETQRALERLGYLDGPGSAEKTGR